MKRFRADKGHFDVMFEASGNQPRCARASNACGRAASSC